MRDCLGKTYLYSLLSNENQNQNQNNKKKPTKKTEFIDNSVEVEQWIHKREIEE